MSKYGMRGGSNQLFKWDYSLVGVLTWRRKITDNGCWVRGDDHTYHRVTRIEGGQVGLHVIAAFLCLGHVIETGKKKSKTEICHKCDVPGCFNPAHLFVGDASLNQIDCVLTGRHPEANRTHCIRGHPFSEENTYYNPSTPAKRACRTCIKMWNTRRRVGVVTEVLS